MSDVLRVVRWLLRRPQPKVSRKSAIQLACEEYAQRGWEFGQPKAIERLNLWEIWMYGDPRAGSGVIIDQQTGRIENLGPRTRRVDRKLLFELRTAAKNAAKAGEPTDFVTFDASVPPSLANGSIGSPVLAQLRSRHGDRVLFTVDRLFLERNGVFEVICYRDIADFHCWMKPDRGQSNTFDSTRYHGDDIVLEDISGQHFKLVGLGWGFEALCNFFRWLLRGRLPYRREAVPPGSRSPASG